MSIVWGVGRTLYEADKGGSTGDGTGGESSNAGGFTQTDLDRIIAERLSRAREKWQQEQQAEQDKVAREAEAKRLESQQEFEKLANERQAEIDRLNAQLQGHAARVQQYALKDAFRAEASKAKAAFIDAQAEQDAFALLDLSGVEIGDDGKVAGMDAALKALQGARKYLFAQPEKPGDTNADRGGGGALPQDNKAHEEDVRKRYGIR